MSAELIWSIAFFITSAYALLDYLKIRKLKKKNIELKQRIEKLKKKLR